MKDLLNLTVERLTTPIGELLIAADAFGTVRAIDWVEFEERMRRLLKVQSQRDTSLHFILSKNSAAKSAIEALAQYFNGDAFHSGLDTFKRIPVAMSGTLFQREVWFELRKIPFGSTISYQELAQRIGNPKAVRAVGRAVGDNPIGVLVPCHRVIKSDGSLSGYAGGIPRKEWLLEHEKEFA